MKSLTSWFVLVVSIAVIVSSCAKSDDSKTATTSSTDNTTSSSDDSSDDSSDNSTSTSDNSSSSSSSTSGIFVTTGQWIYKSIDGITWDNTTSNLPDHWSLSLYDVVYGNDTFVGVGEDGHV